MKKTTSIHIKGINFIIEEEAYETLKKYMERLNRKLANTKGKEEIIEDIELRIAELFSAELKGGKQVIEESDVENTISTLGEPEEYIDEEFQDENDREQRTNNSFDSENDDQDKKKLYRDLDNASIAGVCSGLAIYFNIDVILIRIIFILLMIGGGFGFPLYIILWIVLPTANSHIDRLRMKGKRITVDSVQEEVEQAAERLSRSSKNMRSGVQSDAIRKTVHNAGRIISKVIGFFLLIVGLTFSLFFVFIILAKKGVFPIQDENGMLSPYQFAELLVDAPQLSQMWWVSGFLVLLFILFIVATAMRFILNNRYPWYKHLSRFTIVVSIISVIYAFYVAATITKEFSVESEIRSEILTTNENLNIQFSKSPYHANDGKNVRSKNMAWFYIKDGQIMDQEYKIQIREAKDSLFHVFYVKSAHGVKTSTALDRAQNINFPADLSNDTLALPSHFTYPKKDKLRHQRVKVYVEIPAGKSIVMNDKTYYPKEYSYSIYSSNWEGEWKDSDWNN